WSLRVSLRPSVIIAILGLTSGLLSACAAAQPAPPPDDRVAFLPPIEFNLEEDTFANEPISDADPAAPMPRRRGGGPFGAAAPVSIGGFWAPPVAVDGQADELAVNAQFARVAVPIGVPAEGRPLWLAIAKFGRLELATAAVLPDSGQPIPDQLWLVETGFMHVRPLADGGSIGGTFLFGTASDRPYAATRDLTLMAVGFYNRPAGRANDEWSFSLFYSPTSQLPYPLPGIAYAWRPSDRFEAKIGLPPALEWRPTDDWTFTANYFPLVNFNATARRRLADALALLAFYRSDTEIYFLADRLQDDQRFFVFDQRAAVGVEQTLGRGFTLEATASYIFDRTLFQGTNFSSGRTDVVTFDDGLGLSLQLLWRR
ncbi:MAG: hypothetical protein EBS56_02685, partial [Planctomycetia bacterium]|nr:hypothetical protein [Planctomycetia bacterium]